MKPTIHQRLDEIEDALGTLTAAVLRLAQAMEAEAEDEGPEEDIGTAGRYICSVLPGEED